MANIANIHSEWRIYISKEIQQASSLHSQINQQPHTEALNTMGNCIGHDSTKNTRDSVEVVVLQSPLNARGSKGRAASAKTKAKNGGNGGDSFVDVLFFPDPGMPCKNFRSAKGCTRKNCKMIHDEGSSLLTFLEWLNKAKKTMEVCVFTITCDEVWRAVCIHVWVFDAYS